MKLSGWFVSPAPFSGKKTVVLETIMSTDYFYLVGKSLPTSTDNDLKNSVTTLMISLPEGKTQGVLALKVWIARANVSSCRKLFLRVTLKDGKPFIDFDNVYLSANGRIGQVTEGGIEVLIGETRYTSDKNNAEKEGYRYVSDSDLLCRYLEEEVALNVVTEAAEEEVKKTDAQMEIIQLKKVADGLSKEIESHLKTIQVKDGNLSQLTKICDDKELRNANQESTIKELRDYIERLHIAIFDIGEKAKNASFGDRKEALEEIVSLIQVVNSQNKKAIGLGVLEKK